MDASPLGALAAELRNMIWELAITHDDHVLVAPQSCGNSTEYKAPFLRNKHAAAMLSVCKQMRSECSALFYSLNTFEVRTGCHNWRDTSTIEEKFYESIGDYNRQMTKSMHFSITLPDCPACEPSEAELRSPASRELRWFHEVRDDLASIVKNIDCIKEEQEMDQLQASINLKSPSTDETDSWYTFQLELFNTNASFEHAAILQRRRWPRSDYFPTAQLPGLGCRAASQMVWALYCHNTWQN
ncbi:hypothetical protein CBER1_02305 [Cercospora berteroae]|uniref:2EXR domain-containing protein n=1 Tax=Cercospora berteroae TaxID=357750 RepID=A0A2S6CM27_9PEZI|nr:hypothetical protein CBER1_02305 [Cercospora berteroae]